MDHVGRNGLVAACQREKFGSCRICELIDRDGPHYREGYRRMFHPEEFPDAPPPVVARATTAPSSPPGLMAKAATFARAVVTHAVAGLPQADEATAQARLAICRACPEFNTTEPERPTCNKCGCRMDIKVYWSEQVCPIGKW